LLIISFQLVKIPMVAMGFNEPLVVVDPFAIVPNVIVGAPRIVVSDADANATSPATAG
jgi:hypothetical protein